MKSLRYRPIVSHDRARPSRARVLAGGLGWFESCERLVRNEEPAVVDWHDVDADVIDALTRPRQPICSLSLAEPRLMGILNVTPDSFSDGGQFHRAEQAIDRAAAIIREGVSILDIGGESTRPGADPVDSEDEIQRVVPVIRSVRRSGFQGVISIDTRKAEVAEAAMKAGADMVNDVSALRFDPDSLDVVRRAGVPVCLMHAKGEPRTMQNDPTYDDVLLDVLDELEERVESCVAAGISRDRILVDPGIGFGKTVEHNLQLIRRLSLFHSLGCGLVFGASRKRFVGTIGQEEDPGRRQPGSIAVGLEALRQGVQVLRVHDIAETWQAVALWRAML
ncbi:MAG: dihydropteroate synthase [Paracoccaceae bacterium]|nr:dihydropteroate synthase [Paracoccaceae bacterium]